MCSLLSLSAFILSLFISLVSAFWGEKQLFIFVSGAQFDTRCQMMCQNVHNLPYAGPAKSYLMSRWPVGGSCGLLFGGFHLGRPEPALWG